MEFNFITNIENCFILVRDTVNLPLVYYSHIPSSLVSLLIGTLVLIKNRTLLGKILFFISITFTVWVIFDLIVWTSYNSLHYMFFWSFFGILTSLLFILTIYFTYVFLFKKDAKNWIKWLFLISLIPIFLLTPTTYNLPSFDQVWCLANEGTIFTTYYYAFGIFAFLVVLLLLFIKFLRTKDKIDRKEDLIFIIGVESFILMFFFTGFLSSYLTDTGVFSSYDYELYGLFGMVIFMSFLAYLIVKFKTFNIKLIGAQALMWGIALLVGSQLFFIKTTTNYILTGVTLLIAVIAGFVLVKSVKKEIALREQLEIANNNQQALIHFITHQIKGFFTKSKAIFASIIEGDFGEASPVIQDMAKTGLESDNKAVTTIQDILSAANLKNGTIAYNFKKVNLAEMIRKIAGTFTDEIDKKGLKFEMDIPAEPLMIMADETQISQAFRNLIDNAMRYTLNGEIKLSLKINPENKNKIIFVIKDTGVGLSESDKVKLFTEGGKGEEAIKVNTNSTGYGLYIVKKIIESHQGKIWAESAGRGHGSKFCVELDVIR